MEQEKKTVEKLEEKLLVKTKKVHELQDLVDMFPYREETEDGLRSEISILKERLARTESELTAIKSHHDLNETKELEERVQQLRGELRQRTQTCSALQERLNQALASLEATRQAANLSKAVEEQPREQLARLQEMLKQKESALQGMLAEKEKVEERCRSLDSQVSELKSHMDNLHMEMTKSVTHVSNLCTLLEDKEKEVERLCQENATLTVQLSDVQNDSRKFLHSYEKAIVEVQEVQEEKEAMATNLKQLKKELEEAVILKAELDSRIASMSSEMAEKEEYRELQVCNLQGSLKKLREQLKEKTVELEQVKAQLQQRRLGDKRSSERSLKGQEHTTPVTHHEVSSCLSLTCKQTCSCCIVSYCTFFIQAAGDSVDDVVESSMPASPERLKDHYHKKVQSLQEKWKVRIICFVSTVNFCYRYYLFIALSPSSWSTWERLLCCGCSMPMR